MKKLNLIIISLILMSFASANILQIAEVRTAKPFEKFNKLFSIVSDKSTYEQGEQAQIEDFQSINANCDLITVNARITRPDGQAVATRDKTLGQGGFMTAFIRFTVDTTTLSPDIYTITSRWFCTQDGKNNELGQDGAVDSNKDPAVSQFSVVKKSLFKDPVQTCSKQCNVGYELINPDSPSCQCSPTWNDNDGRCDLGEPIVNNDCETSTPNEPNPSSTSIELILGVGVLLVALIIGVIILKK